MTNNGHHLVGLGVAVASGLLAHRYGLSLGNILMFCAALVSGANAPDWMEISSAKRDWKGVWRRTSVIAHRTWTHWLPLWVAMLGFGLYLGWNLVWFAPALVGFSLGGLLHLLVDLPNPMGIPIVHPWKRRTSLKWWKSGENEALLIIGAWLPATLMLVAGVPGLTG